MLAFNLNRPTKSMLNNICFFMKRGLKSLLIDCDLFGSFD
jgi:hypothetical protein